MEMDHSRICPWMDSHKDSSADEIIWDLLHYAPDEPGQSPISIFGATGIIGLDCDDFALGVEQKKFEESTIVLDNGLSLYVLDGGAIFEAMSLGMHEESPCIYLSIPKYNELQKSLIAEKHYPYRSILLGDSQAIFSIAC